MSQYAFKKGVTYDTNLASGDHTELTFDMVRNAQSFLAEHFGCFSLYAFDHAGRPYKIVHAESELERMALERLSETDLAMANADFDLLDEDIRGDQGGDSLDDSDDDEPYDDAGDPD